jgi:hypothetical protein
MLQAFGTALGWNPITYGDIRPFYVVGRPGFWGGFGSILDIFSPLQWNYPLYGSADEASAVSVYTDWCLVGNDLATAMEHHQPLLAA